MIIANWTLISAAGAYAINTSRISINPKKRIRKKLANNSKSKRASRPRLLQLVVLNQT